MKHAFLLHGTGGSNTNYFWFRYIKEFLESCEYQVWWPLLPDTSDPDLHTTKQFIIDNMPDQFNEATILIGHSSACPVILDILQSSDAKIDKALLVSGFYMPIDTAGRSAKMLPSAGFKWSRIKTKAEEIIMINSDNDPWGCDDVQARVAAIKLGAKLILNVGEGHMGSGVHRQPYKEFPLIKRLLCT